MNLGLKNFVKSVGIQEAERVLCEALGATQRKIQDPDSTEPNAIRLDRFSYREMWEAFCGEGTLELLNPFREQQSLVTPRMLREESAAVGFTAFLNINGQIVFSKILESYKRPEFKLAGLVETMPSRFSGEKIPQLTNLDGDEDEVVEGAEYGRAGFGEAYLDTPDTVKRGTIVELTKEAIFFDKVGTMFRQAGTVGAWLAQRKENRIADECIGVTNGYQRNGTATNTFQTTAPWVNDQVNVLADWTDLDNAEHLLAAMTDPDTGDPIMISGDRVLLCSAQLEATAAYISTATESRRTDGGAVTMVGGNPARTTGHRVVGSRTLYHRHLASGLSAAESRNRWYWGSLSDGLLYVENWAIGTVMAPPNSEAEFTRDVLHRVKASERGVITTQEPRAIVRNTTA